MRTQIKNILVPIDFSEKSKNAMNLAAQMAIRHEAKLILLHICPTFNLIDRTGKQVIGAETLQENLTNAEEELDELKVDLQIDHNISIQTIIKTENIIDGINELVQTENVDLVVIGTSGKHNLKQLFLGSNSYNVLLNADCSVLLVPETFNQTFFKKILFPVRVKSELLEKTDLSILLANKNDGDINLLGVENVNALQNIKETFNQIERNLQLKAASFFSEFKSSDDNAKIIANATKENDCDLILLSDQDEDSWKSFMADNFFKKIINETNVPLFIVKSHLKKINNKSERITSYDVSLPIPG